ncbi:hypothetical protein LT493_00775 [Streptomyces tricolor]|nr:hypothetical protein [Streptomyces tricolor]
MALLPERLQHGGAPPALGRGRAPPAGPVRPPAAPGPPVRREPAGEETGGRAGVTPARPRRCAACTSARARFSPAHLSLNAEVLGPNGCCSAPTHHRWPRRWRGLHPHDREAPGRRGGLA